MIFFNFHHICFTWGQAKVWVWGFDHSELCTSFRRPKPQILHIFEKFCQGFKYFLHQLSTFCRSVRQGTYFSITYSKFCVETPQPKDPSRRTLVERKLQEDASRGYLPLEAICLSRLFASRGFKGADTSRDRDEEKCFARMKASRGCFASRG